MLRICKDRSLEFSLFIAVKRGRFPGHEPIGSKKKNDGITHAKMLA
jgi:hypothetical protein